MWLMKNVVMDKFAAEVKKGKYKKIDYQTWRELKKLPDEWDLDIIYSLNNCSDVDSRYVSISWDGCIYPYEFSANDGSLGEYIKTLLDFYNAPSLSAFSNAINKVSEAAVNAGAAITAAAQASKWTTSISSSFYEKQPTVEISEKGLKIKGQTIDEIIDDATGVSIRKENNNMTNLIKGFNFGSCENDNVKMSMYGIAVKNANGTWVSYDAKNGNIIDVDILNFNAKYLYKMPVAIKDIKAGDVVIHNRVPMFVSKVEDGKILATDPAAGEEKVILLTKNLFGFDFATKVVNLFGDISSGVSADAPFGNMLPMLMLADGDKTDDMLPLMLAMGGGKLDMSNPMMLYFLMKDNKSDNLLPLMLMANNGNFALGKTCHCDCDREG